MVELALRWQDVRDAGPAPAPDFDAHHALARRAAAAGTVLLTNDGLLPLPAEGTIAVIGAFAVEPRYQGAGSSKVNPTRVDALLDALTEQTAGRAEIRYAAGYDPVTGDTTPIADGRGRRGRPLGGPGRAGRRASRRGWRPRPWTAPSGRCRRGWTSWPRSCSMRTREPPWCWSTVASSTSRGPTGPRRWSRPTSAARPGARHWPTCCSGPPSPVGGWPESIPFDVTQLPADRNFPGHPRQVEYRETFNVGYRFHDTHDVPARFPFGHGLTYTTFAYGEVEVTGSGTELVVAVDVTNTGTRPGSEVVQVYVRDLESTLPRPAKELAGFAKVHLEPGQTARAEVALGRRSFAVWDVAAGDWLVEAGEYEILVGASSTDVRGSVTVHVESDDVITPVPVPAGPVATDAEFAALLGQAHPGARRASARSPAPRPRPTSRPAVPDGAWWRPCAGGCSASSRPTTPTTWTTWSMRCWPACPCAPS